MTITAGSRLGPYELSSLGRKSMVPTTVVVNWERRAFALKREFPRRKNRIE